MAFSLHSWLVWLWPEGFTEEGLAGTEPMLESSPHQSQSASEVKPVQVGL